MKAVNPVKKKIEILFQNTGKLLSRILRFWTSLSALRG
jgi:hypothetical protein